jgi:hypothetical protein
MSHYYTPIRAQRGGGGINLTSLQLGARMVWVVCTTLRPSYPLKTPWSTVQEAGDPRGQSGGHRGVHQNSITGPSILQRVVRLTTLSRPTVVSTNQYLLISYLHINIAILDATAYPQEVPVRPYHLRVCPPGSQTICRHVPSPPPLHSH